MNEKVSVGDFPHLGLDAFSVKPEASLIVPKYQVFEPVTRLSWTAFLINNFSIGRADWGRQKAHFSWFEARTGFDWDHAVASFMSAGGWNIMIPEERDLFVEIFKRVGRHNLEQFMSEPKTRLDYQLMKVRGAEISYFTRRHALATMDEEQLKAAMDESFVTRQSR